MSADGVYGFGINWLGLLYVAGAFTLAAWSDLLGLAAWAVGLPFVYVIGRVDEKRARGDLEGPR